jgi:hypothetical protein
MSLDHFLTKLRQWGRPWTAGSEPVELHRAILEEVESQVVAVGGGRRIFPFDRVEVKLLAVAPAERARLEAVTQAGWDLEREIRERLKARDARAPERLEVPLQVTEVDGPEFGGRRYAVAFSRSAAPGAATPAPAGAGGAGGVAGAPTVAVPVVAGARAGGGAAGAAGAAAALPDGDSAGAAGAAAGATGSAAASGAAVAAAAGGGEPGAPEPVETVAAAGAAAQAGAGQGDTHLGLTEAPTTKLPRPGEGAPWPQLRLSVLKGKAVREVYTFAADRIQLGRLEEVLDHTGRVRRRNDVAFLEEGDVNETVSREHARIGWDAESRAYWLRDEGSASGTIIFRAGRPIEVSRHDRRGVRLQTGDELYLGRAALRLEIEGAPAR